MRPPQVKEIIALMEEWIPSWSAEPWDKIGLISGEPKNLVQRIMIALELNDSLLNSALEQDQQMLLLHHPPFLNYISDLRSDQPISKRLLKAATQNLAIFVAHTNLDIAPGGVNDALATNLNLINLRPLVTTTIKEKQAKLITFTPYQYAEKIAQALFKAGAGHVGNYRECVFYSTGEGHFLAPKNEKPFLGRTGEREQIAEKRLEITFPLNLLTQIINALDQAHPYKEPIKDIYILENNPPGFGLGRVGNLPSPELGQSFLSRAAYQLQSTNPAVAGLIPKIVERVAVVGGSGGKLLTAAANAGAQILITGEAHYHAAQEAIDLGIGLLTLGHFETENVIIDSWAKHLTSSLSIAGFTAQVIPWKESKSPWRSVLNSKEKTNIASTN